MTVSVLKSMVWSDVGEIDSPKNSAENRRKQAMEVQKELLAKIDSLETENRELSVAVKDATSNISDLEGERDGLRDQLEGMKPLMDIPCCYCGKPLGNEWPSSHRDSLVAMFRSSGWHHSGCKPSD